MYIEGKTNWTSSDYINCEDLNRVESNTKYIAEKLIEYSYFTGGLHYKTNWIDTDVIYSEDLNRIERNIKTIIESYVPIAKYEKYEELKMDWKTLDSVQYDFANRIEKNLEVTNWLIEIMENNFIYSGVATSGQNRMWQQRYRRSVYTPVVMEEATITGIYNADQVIVTGVGTHYKGYTVTLNATAIEGNRIIRATVDGEVVTLPYTFKLNKDTIFSIVSEAIPQYIVNVNYNSNQVTISGAGTYYENTSVTLNATPNTGYQIENIKLDETDINLPYTFEISKDVTLEVESSIIQYEVNVEYDPSQIEATESGIYDYGTTVTLTATPLTGYKINSILVNGIERTLPYTLNITEDVSVAITSSIITLTASATYNADQVEITGLGTYDYGEEVTIDAKAVDGYKVDSITINNTEITVPYTFIITSDIALNVTSSALITTATVTATYDESQVTVTGLGTYNLGAEVTINVVALDGYQVESITLEGNAITVPYTFTLSENVSFEIESSAISSEPKAWDYSTDNLVFTGSNYVDTGIKLFDTAKSWVVICSLSTTDTGTSNTTAWHSMYESSPYPGISFDLQGSLRGRLAMKTSLSNVFPVSLTGTQQTMAVERDVETETYTLFVMNQDGTVTTTDITSRMSVTTFDTTLTLGAYQTTSGTYGRNWRGTIYGFRVKLDTMTEDEIKTVMAELQGGTITSYNVTGTYDSTQVTLEGLGTYAEGTEITINATPIDGYQIDSITVNGIDVTVPYTFTVTADTVITVTSSALPAYTEAEALISSGTQYIDVDYIPNNTTRLVMDMMITTSATQFWFGSRISYSSRGFTLLSTGSTFRSDYGTTTGTARGVNLNTRYTVDKNREVTTVYNTDGGTVWTETNVASEFICPSNAYLFAVNSNGSLSAPGSCKLYGCQIYDNDTLVRDFIPVLDADSVPCLYDKVSNTNFYNTGSGSFTYE